MTNVIFAFDDPSKSGVDVPSSGTLHFSLARAEETDGVVRTTKSFSVSLFNGRATVPLSPTPVGQAWHISVDSLCGVRDWWKTVPNVSEIDFTDLTDVDRNTLTSTITPEPAWWAALNDVSISGLPEGGSLGDVLTKSSSENFESSWVSQKPVVFGSFYDTQTQALTEANVSYPVKIRTVDASQGVSVLNGSEIVVSRDGNYNIQHSLQVVSNTNQIRILHLWARINGVNVPHSSTRLTIASKDEIVVPAWNFLYQMNSGDRFELMAMADGIGVSIESSPGNGVSPNTYPETPSAIITIHSVD